MDQRQEPEIGQLEFPAIGDRDLGGTLHGDVAIVGHVSSDRDRAVREGYGHSLGTVDVAVQDDDGHAARRQVPDCGRPEAPTSSGDQSATPVQLHQLTIRSAPAQ